MKKEKNKHYISGRESNQIAKDNAKAIKELQRRNKAYTRDDYVTQMRDPANIVEFDELHTYFYTDRGVVKAVNGVSFDIPAGSTVGIVGESGCGKSVTSMSMMRLIQAPMGQIYSGSIRFRSNVRTHVGKEPMTEQVKDEEGNPVLDENGVPVTRPVLLPNGKPRMHDVYEEHEEVLDLAKLPMSEMSKIRGREIAMIFQEPMTSLNPVFTIGYQLDEVSLLHINGVTKEEAKQKSIEMLKLVGIAMPEHVYKSYPHELSGGMRQRVMIAMALCCNPRLIIADEPTTALDVTIQAQILDLLREIKHKISGSIMFITHDLGVIAEMADYVVVMYAGRIVEKGTVEEIFNHPLHPYTIGLQKSKPVVGREVDRLYNIPGNVPNPINMPSTCYFRDRCNRCSAECDADFPPMVQVSPTHSVACYLCEQILKEQEEAEAAARAQKEAEEKAAAEAAAKAEKAAQAAAKRATKKKDPTVTPVKKTAAKKSTTPKKTTAKSETAATKSTATKKTASTSKSTTTKSATGASKSTTPKKTTGASKSTAAKSTTTKKPAAKKVDPTVTPVKKTATPKGGTK